jgi:hypothetical protein
MRNVTKPGYVYVRVINEEKIHDERNERIESFIDAVSGRADRKEVNTPMGGIHEGKELTFLRCCPSQLAGSGRACCAGAPK